VVNETPRLIVFIFSGCFTPSIMTHNLRYFGLSKIITFFYANRVLKLEFKFRLFNNSDPE